MSFTAIITGGSIDLEYLREQNLSAASYLICADRGLMAADVLGLVPDLMVGDFDSVDPAVFDRYTARPDIETVRFHPEKDDTDTELALSLAAERGQGELRIYGGFGTRMDHTMANIGLLKQMADRGIPAVFCDPYNQIRMICDTYAIKRDQAFGDYVSILPYGGAAMGVTLKGFKYPLEHAVMEIGNSLGVSNEIVEDQAVVMVEKGYLLVIESRDFRGGLG